MIFNNGHYTVQALQYIRGFYKSFFLSLFRLKYLENFCGLKIMINVSHVQPIIHQRKPKKFLLKREKGGKCFMFHEIMYFYWGGNIIWNFKASNTSAQYCFTLNKKVLYCPNTKRCLDPFTPAYDSKGTRKHMSLVLDLTSLNFAHFSFLVNKQLNIV